MSNQLQEAQPLPASTNIERFDRNDPIDNLLHSFLYNNTIARPELMPTASEQKDMIKRIQGPNHAVKVEAARQLIGRHKFLIAATAYPYKHHGVESEELLGIAGSGILLAAQTYVPERMAEDDNLVAGNDFSDYAVNVARSIISKRVYGDSTSPAIPGREKPMDSIFNMLTKLENLHQTSSNAKRQNAIAAKLGYATIKEAGIDVKVQYLTSVQAHAFVQFHCIDEKRSWGAIAAELDIPTSTVQLDDRNARDKLVELEAAWTAGFPS